MIEHATQSKRKHVPSESMEKQAKEKKSPEGYKMLIGEGKDSVEARDKWIDAVEKMLEHESFEKGEKHARKGFEEIRDDGDYGLKEPPKWFLC